MDKQVNEKQQQLNWKKGSRLDKLHYDCYLLSNKLTGFLLFSNKLTFFFIL